MISLFNIIKKRKYFFGFIAITFLMGFLFVHSNQDVEEKKIVTNFRPVLKAGNNSNFLESPELILVSKNNIYPATPPVTVEPQVLGSIVGEDDQGETKPSHTKKEITEYTVKEGDSLSSVAKKFGVSVDTILWANENLSKDSTLSPGKKLTILPVDGVMHLVKRGETISEIATKYDIDSDKISSFNELEDEEEIYKGDILILPGAEQIQQNPQKKSRSKKYNSSFIPPTTGKITQKRHFYNAIDVANDCGTHIRSAAGGKVIEVKYDSWPAGNYVKIEHYNGLITMYAHLSKVKVTTGDKVSQGEQIGNMGTTGHSTGCHLHFDLLSNTAVNPLSKHNRGDYISW
ncbi:MAG: peptidoglycan DD-metalloendopeptidase family protein [Minisyncoccales bacterium]